MEIVDIYNRALRRLGSKELATKTDDTKTADLCNLYFQETLDEMINSADWNVAIGRIELVADAGDNFTKFDYKYVLTLTPKVLKVYTMINEDDETYEDIDDDFIIEANFLYTDVTPCSIKYQKQFTDVTTLPELFAIALSLRLASKICFAITKDLTLFQAIGQEFAIANENAKQQDGAFSRQPDQPEDWW